MSIKADPHQGLRDAYASALLVRTALLRALHDAVEAERHTRTALCQAAGEAAVTTVRAQFITPTPLQEPRHV